MNEQDAIYVIISDYHLMMKIWTIFGKRILEYSQQKQFLQPRCELLY